MSGSFLRSFSRAPGLLSLGRVCFFGAENAYKVKTYNTFAKLLHPAFWQIPARNVCRRAGINKPFSCWVGEKDKTGIMILVIITCKNLTKTVKKLS